MREFLKGLDFDKETIDTIMAEYGKQVQGFKEQIEDFKNKEFETKKEISDYQTQIDTLSKSVEEKDKSLENLQSVTNENADLKAQIEINGANVKKEFERFVTNEVRGRMNDETDFSHALEDYKRDNPQYFGETVIKTVQTSPELTGGDTQPQNTNSIMNDIIRGAR